MQTQQPLMELSDLMKAVKAVMKQRVGYEKVAQDAAVACVGYSIAHRNIDPAKQLIEAVSSHHKRTLVAFFEKFGNMAWTGKGKDAKLEFFCVGEKDQKPKLIWTAEYAAEVAAFHWTKAIKAPEPVSKYDAVDILDAAFKRLDKLASDDGITLANREAYIKAKAAYLGVLSGLLGTRTIDATDLTAPSREFEKQQAFAQKAAEDRANERTPATPEQLQQLEQHLNGDRKAA